MNLPNTLSEPLRKLSLLPLMSGILAVIFALVALFWPGATVTTIVMVLSGYLLLSSLSALFTGLSLRRAPGSRVLTCGGLLGIVLSLTMLWHPGMSAKLLVAFLGCCLLIFGLFIVAVSLAIQRVTQNWARLLPAGAISSVLGLMFLVHPESGPVAIGIMLSLGIFVLGLSLIAAGIQLRRFGAKLGAAAGEGMYEDTTVIEGDLAAEDTDEPRPESDPKRELPPAND